MSKHISCPFCRFEITDSGTETEQVTVCPQCKRRLDDQTCIESVGSTDEGEQLSQATELDQKLPPKFLVDDPEFIDHQYRNSSVQNVLLPDGRGGLTSVKENIVRIEHRGKTIDLIALLPDEKRKRQRTINVVSIVLGIVFLIIVFCLI